MRRSFFGRRLGRKAGFFAMALVMVAGIAAIGGLVMLLWNWLMPALFIGTGRIDYWQALGLLLLCKLLFGVGRGHGHARRRHWESMSPEEQAHFKEHFKAHFPNRWAARFGGDDKTWHGPRSTGPAAGHDTAGGMGPHEPGA